MSESEVRERADHEAAAIGVRCAFGLLAEAAGRDEAGRIDAFAHSDPCDRRAILDGMRLAMREDGGSRYHHPAACRALDQVEGESR